MASLPTQGGELVLLPRRAPGTRMSAATGVRRAILFPLAGLAPGESRAVDVFGTTVAVFNVNGVLHALENRCAHHGGPLCRGRVAGTLLPSAPGEYRYDPDRRVVICPWHGWEYDLVTGRALFDPGVFVRAFDARREGDDVVLYERRPG